MVIYGMVEPICNFGRCETMKNLILLRHAKSDWSGSSVNPVNDIDRPLSSRGRSACHKISKFLFGMRLSVDLVEYSSAERARETLMLIKKSLRFSKCQQNAELYTFNWKKLMNVIANKSDSIKDLFIVGHNPAIEDLIFNLVPRNDTSENFEIMQQKYPTGAIAFLELNILSWNGLSENSGRIKQFVRPKDIIH